MKLDERCNRAARKEGWIVFAHAAGIIQHEHDVFVGACAAGQTEQNQRGCAPKQDSS
jgi:hypothetical protein